MFSIFYLIAYVSPHLALPSQPPDPPSSSIDLSNRTIIYPSPPSSTPYPPPRGYKGNFIALVIPEESKTECPYCDLGQCGDGQLCYIRRTGLRGDKSTSECISESSLSLLLHDPLMSAYTHDACQTSKAHHETAYCWCSPSSRVTVTDELHRIRLWRYQTLRDYANEMRRTASSQHFFYLCLLSFLSFLYS